MLIIKPITKFNHEELNNFMENKISNLDHKIIISRKFKKNNLSFVLLDDKQIKAICPLSYEKNGISNKKYKQGAFFGISLPGVIISDNLSNKEMRQILSSILVEIDRLCKKNSIKNIKICFSDLINFDLNSLKFQTLSRLLLQFKYLNISMVGNRIDLRKDINILNKSISKGHKAILKNNNYLLKYQGSEKKLNYKSFFNLIRQIRNHQEYIKYLYEFYKNDQLEIVNIYEGKEKIAFAIFTKVNKTVEYFCSKNIYKDKNAHHSLILDVINKYKKDGFSFLNLGVISYGPQLHYIPTKKHINISIFKRGFKGENYPLQIYEKYFSKKTFQEQQNLRIKNFSNLIS